MNICKKLLLEKEYYNIKKKIKTHEKKHFKILKEGKRRIK